MVLRFSYLCSKFIPQITHNCFPLWVFVASFFSKCFCGIFCFYGICQHIQMLRGFECSVSVFKGNIGNRMHLLFNVLAQPFPSIRQRWNVKHANIDWNSKSKLNTLVQEALSFHWDYCNAFPPWLQAYILAIYKGFLCAASMTIFLKCKSQFVSPWAATPFKLWIVQLLLCQ